MLLVGLLIIFVYKPKGVKASRQNRFTTVKPGEKIFHNDFESVVFNAHPLIKSIKDHLYEQGAMYASLKAAAAARYMVYFHKKQKATLNFLQTISASGFNILNLHISQVTTIQQFLQSNLDLLNHRS